MFHTDFTNNNVYEYTLSCGFGVKTCTDPTNDKDDVASIESQSEATKKLYSIQLIQCSIEWNG